MSTQDFYNHKKYYPPHHFVFYPVILVGILLSFYFANKYPIRKVEFYFFGGILFIIAWLSFMLRQHYALGNQNRIIRLEMRLRYFQLTNKRLEEVENQLIFPQIAALRFASDEELPELIRETINKKLSASQIKKSIKNWNPDYMRV